MTAPYARAWQERQRATFAALSRQTESPLEGILLAALLAENDGADGYFFTDDGPNRIVAQHEVDNGRRRIDFAVFAGDRKIAVEVDSAEWHGSPELAAETDARARELESIGWEVVSFAGADVSRRPRECARYLRELIEHAWYDAPPATQEVPVVHLSPSQVVRAEQLPEESAAYSLFRVVLREPHHIHKADVFAALTRDDGVTALAAEALRQTTDPHGNVDARAFLSSCPALLQPDATKRLVATRGTDNPGVAFLIELYLSAVSTKDHSALPRRRR